MVAVTSGHSIALTVCAPQVYTLPVSDRASLPDVTLKVRRRSERACGQPISAGIAEAGAVLSQVVEMPECGDPQVADIGAIVMAAKPLNGGINLKSLTVGYRLFGTW